MSGRRGACPALAEPMRTGDGLLVRLTLADRSIAPQSLVAIANAAARFGSGVMEVSARGNLQVRGLTTETAPLFAHAVAELGLDVRAGVPIDVGPLAGLDPDEARDPRPLAGQIRGALAQKPPALGPKVSVVLDGGGRLHLGDLAGDVRLTAHRHNAEIGWAVGLAGTVRTAKALGWVEDRLAAAAATTLLAAIAELGPQARARDLDPAEMRTRLAGLLSDLAGPKASPAKPEPIGIHRLREGDFAIGLGLPFGHATAEQLSAVADHAARLGAASLRFAPGRALLAVGLAEDGVRQLRAQAEALGFVVEASDPRRTVVACAGAPACASGELPTQPLARRIAADRTGFLDGSLTVHLAGCDKGCAHAGAAGLTLVGGMQGCGLVLDGSTKDLPIARTTPAEAVPAFERLASLVSATRNAGETTAACLLRLGPARLAAAFGSRS